MRILFVTDLHGSTQALRKAIDAASAFDVEVLLLGGDVSGKRILPLLRRQDGDFDTAELFSQKDDTGKMIEAGRPRTIARLDLPQYLRRLEAKGLYWHECEPAEFHHLNEEVEDLRLLFRTKIRDRLCTWATLINELLPHSLDCLWTGGNDDEASMLDSLTIGELGRFVYAENRVVNLDGLEIVSLGHSNITGFETERELDDTALFERLRLLAEKATTVSNLVLNVHPPPLRCGVLDLVVDPDDPSKQTHVGSRGVRQFLQTYQPLCQFAGHIHEGKGVAFIGRTQIFNPGSDYYSGILQGYVVSIDRSGPRGYTIRDYIHIVR